MLSFETKPDGMLDAEWVAMHMDIRDPNIRDVGFIGEIKRVIIEIAAWRLSRPEARMILKSYLDSRGYSANLGFPGNPDGSLWPVVADSIDDLASFDRLNWTLSHQMDVIHGAREFMRGLQAPRVESHPGWMLTKNKEGPQDWKTRWARAGGQIYSPLINGRDPETEETGLIALKHDPVWKALGSSAIFEDGINRSHPPFCFHPGLGWKEVARWELEEMGALPQRHGLLDAQKKALVKRLRDRAMERKLRSYERADEFDRRIKEE